MKLKYLLLFLFCSVGAYARQVQEKMDKVMAHYADNGAFNGTVLVAQHGAVIYKKAYGFRNAEKKVPHEADDIYQIGSITKSMTAAVIMQLEEEKKLSVHDKLDKYFPTIANAQKITIEHLLTHTSGLYNFTNDTAVMGRDVTRHYSAKEMLALFAGYTPDFEPGARWNYSNTAYSLLGYIIEKVEKKPYEQVVRERIFKPLRMTDSGFDFAGLKSERKSKGYFALSKGNGLPAPIVDSTIGYAAGAVYATAEDLLKWERGIAAGKLLKPASWKKVFTPKQKNYGYGWAIDSLFGREFHAHSGGIHGFASYLIRFPQDGLAVILLDNASSTKLAAIANTLAAITLEQPYELPGVKKEITLDTAVLKQYVGEYQLAPNFIITVSLHGTQLKAQATGQPQFELFAETTNKFFLKVVEASVEFVKDASGAVTEMILYQNGASPRGKKIK